MVNQSDAPFRSLCLKYGSTCVYSEMLLSEKVVTDDSYLSAHLPIQDHLFKTYKSRPLVVQVSGNTPDILSKCVEKLVSLGNIDAIDFNLGCPQICAQEGTFGSYLLDKCHWNTVFDCVQAMSLSLKLHGIPLFCKIRICEGDQFTETTKEFCKKLYENGADLICVHGRKRGSTKFRRCGSADLDLIKEVSLSLSDCIPVIANGNISCRDDVLKNLQYVSPAVGVMSAEGILADPLLFYYAAKKTHGFDLPSLPDRAALFTEYCELSNAYASLEGWELLEKYCAGKLRPDRDTDPPESRQLATARQHLTWMLGKSGHGRTVRFRHSGPYTKQVHLLIALNQATSLADLVAISDVCLRGVQSSLPYGAEAGNDIRSPPPRQRAAV